MIKVAPAPEKAAQVKPATANISLVPAIRVTNTLAPVPAIPAVQALLATVNTPPAPAHHLTLGAGAPALAQVTILIPALAPITLVVLVPPAAASMWLVPAPLAMNGRTALVQY